MIGSIRGILLSRAPGSVIVEAAGVGYELAVPTGTLSDLPGLGQEVFLHVYTSVREDAIQLFGFGSEEEKRVFITLLGVSGIGPKVALNVISGIPYEEFLRAVDSEDVALLSKTPGLGKKTAGRIVLELRGKLPKEGGPVDGVYADTLSALINLGYGKSEARESIEMARRKGFVDDVEGLLRESLKCLTGAADEKG
jgi:Holliday junction DNA helicase RuvA